MKYPPSLMTIRSWILLMALSIFFFTNISLAHPGTGLVKDSKGNIYFTDLEHIWRIDTSGQLSIAVENKHSHELFIDEYDNLYGEHEYYTGATDTWIKQIWKLDAEGNFKILSEHSINQIIISPIKNYHHAHFGIKKGTKLQSLILANPDGKCTHYSNASFNDIRWMHYDKINYDLYLIDGLAIKRLDETKNMQLLTQFTAINTPFNKVSKRHYLFGMHSKFNHLYVAVFGEQKVVSVNKIGIRTPIYYSEPTWSPSGVFMESQKEFWVLEYNTNNNARVCFVNASGKKTYFTPNFNAE